jgi:hypothetical protein
MTDEEFRSEFKPLQVPPAYERAQSVTDKVVFALADIGEGTAEAVVRHIEWLDPDADHKMVIAKTHEVLTVLFQKGLLGGREDNGDLIFNLHKITEANDGATNPDLLAPGLD